VERAVVMDLVDVPRQTSKPAGAFPANTDQKSFVE
jgi:hypothetical protein